MGATGETVAVFGECMHDNLLLTMLPGLDVFEALMNEINIKNSGLSGP